MLTKSLALELAPQKIRVNAVNPEEVETPMMAAAFKNRALPPGPNLKPSFSNTILRGRIPITLDRMKSQSVFF